MRVPKKELENRLAEAAKAPHKLPETGNKRQRLADQTRKISASTMRANIGCGNLIALPGQLAQRPQRTETEFR